MSHRSVQEQGELRAGFGFGWAGIGLLRANDTLELTSADDVLTTIIHRTCLATRVASTYDTWRVLSSHRRIYSTNLVNTSAANRLPL